MGATWPKLSSVVQLMVSIHAPVMGATGFGYDKDMTIDVSIHAPVMGATEAPKKSLMDALFQSTRP